MLEPLLRASLQSTKSQKIVQRPSPPVCGLRGEYRQREVRWGWSVLDRHIGPWLCPLAEGWVWGECDVWCGTCVCAWVSV
eukprot:27951-Eustigmatos_ZCMA.PRE.1